MKPDFLHRLERLLVLIPFVAKHRAGAPLAEVLAFGGYRNRAELEEDLALAAEIGLPPEEPGDFLEITIQDDKVEALLPQRFNRPPRLTVDEASALSASLRALGDSVGKTLAAALDRLRHALPEGVEEALAAAERRIAIEPPAATRWHDVLERAIERRNELTLAYWAQSRDVTTNPTVEPLRLHVHRGHWYLVAWNPALAAERTYRVDRITGVQVNARVFEPRQSFALARHDDTMFASRGAEPQAEVRFSAALGGYVGERWPEQSHRNADGSWSVVCPVRGGEAHFLSWILGFGGEAELVSPESLRAALRLRVQQLQRIYVPMPAGAAADT